MYKIYLRDPFLFLFYLAQFYVLFILLFFNFISINNHMVNVRNRNTEQFPLSASPHPLTLEQVLVLLDLKYYLDQFRLRQKNMSS